ncbi:Serine/threonine-protein kinase B-raf [Fasciola gigantica]|uniref:Serine/threonine-protein kinase B-raf n=1 Tax=Fasciola gigantica TaxID=46835 RepID=A0A504Z3A9_FASGI|nr:Serine/threonine-protein kinase B-raf [Fasciola gigantica]
MTTDNDATVVSILQQRCSLLDSKLKNFNLVSKALQAKTYQLLNVINKHEDYSGLITKEYDEVSNDINCVQAVIEKYSTELEELRFKIKQYTRDNPIKSGRPIPPQVVLPHNQPDPTQSLVKLRLRAYLPNSQFTLVEIRPGQQIQHVLGKKLSHRGLHLEQLIVYRARSGLPVSWEDDAVSVAHLGEELVVDFARRNLKRSEHQFQRKTFFEKAHCNLCHKFIFHVCGSMYHQRCVTRVEKTCLPVPDDDVFYSSDQQRHCIGSSIGQSHLGSNWLSPSNAASTLPGGHVRYRYTPGDATMRLPSGTAIGSQWLDAVAATTHGHGSLLPTGFASPGGHPGRQYLTLTTRERSSSTPNVSNNMISPLSQDCDPKRSNDFMEASTTESDLMPDRSAVQLSVPSNATIHRSCSTPGKKFDATVRRPQYLVLTGRSTHCANSFSWVCNQRSVDSRVNGLPNRSAMAKWVFRAHKMFAILQATPAFRCLIIPQFRSVALRPVASRICISVFPVPSVTQMMLWHSPGPNTNKPRNHEQ